MKRDAKPDGCKTRAKRRKNRGARRPGRVGEGAAPKSEMQRGYGEGPGDRSGSSAKRRPPHQWWRGRGGWGRDAQLGDSQGWGPPRRRLRSSAVRGRRSRRAVFILGGCGGVRPLPTPRSPASSPLARATSYICKYGERDWVRPPTASSGPGGLSPPPTPGTGPDQVDGGDGGRVAAEWRERQPQRGVGREREAGLC